MSDTSPLFTKTSNVLRDITIVELQKNKVTSVNQFSALVKDILESGENTLLFAVYNSSNQRSYLTVKIN